MKKAEDACILMVVVTAWPPVSPTVFTSVF